MYKLTGRGVECPVNMDGMTLYLKKESVADLDALTVPGSTLVVRGDDGLVWDVTQTDRTVVDAGDSVMIILRYLTATELEILRLRAEIDYLRMETGVEL